MEWDFQEQRKRPVSDRELDEAVRKAERDMARRSKAQKAADAKASPRRKKTS